MGIAISGVPAGCEGLGRCVGTSLLNFVRPSQAQMSLRTSSEGKSRNETRGPASKPITFTPARANGSAATPPAAPRPTMTTSVFFSLIAISASRADLEDRVVGGRLVRRRHVDVQPLLPRRHG